MEVYMDISELYALIDRFEKSGLSELVFKQNSEEVCLKKAIAQSQPAGQAAQVPASPGSSASAAAGSPADVPSTASQAPAAAPDAGIEIISAPLVGTFYRSPTPDTPPFVVQGDRVAKGRPLCILEAMKLMNEFQAEFDLVILDILVENGTLVDFGAPLFRVRRA